MGQGISIIGHPLPSMALVEVVEKQLRRPSSRLASWVWMAIGLGRSWLALNGYAAARPLPCLRRQSHLPKPSFLEQQVLRVGILQSASCTPRPIATSEVPKQR